MPSILGSITEALSLPVPIPGLSQCQAPAAAHDAFMSSKPAPHGRFFYIVCQLVLPVWGVTLAPYWTTASVWWSEGNTSQIPPQWHWQILLSYLGTADCSYLKILNPNISHKQPQRLSAFFSTFVFSKFLQNSQPIKLWVLNGLPSPQFQVFPLFSHRTTWSDPSQQSLTSSNLCPSWLVCCRDKTLTRCTSEEAMAYRPFINKRSQSKNLEAGAETGAMEGCCLLGCIIPWRA